MPTDGGSPFLLNVWCPFPRKTQKAPTCSEHVRSATCQNSGLLCTRNLGHPGVGYRGMVMMAGIDPECWALGHSRRRRKLFHFGGNAGEWGMSPNVLWGSKCMDNAKYQVPRPEYAPSIYMNTSIFILQIISDYYRSFQFYPEKRTLNGNEAASKGSRTCIPGVWGSICCYLLYESGRKRCPFNVCQTKCSGRTRIYVLGQCAHKQHPWFAEMCSRNNPGNHLWSFQLEKIAYLYFKLFTEHVSRLLQVKTYNIIGSNIGNHVFPQQRYTWFLKRCSLKRFPWSVFFGGMFHQHQHQLLEAPESRAQGPPRETWRCHQMPKRKALLGVERRQVTFSGRCCTWFKWSVCQFSDVSECSVRSLSFFTISPRSSLQVYPFLEMLWLVRQDTWLFHNSEYCSINSQPYSIHIHMFIHINILLIYHSQWYSIHIQWYIHLSTIFNDIPYISYVPKCICMELIYKFWRHLDGHPWMHALEFFNWSSRKQFG